MHFFMYLFIHFISLHVSSIKCSSAGDQIVLVHHLVWLVCVRDCLVCRSYRHTKQSLTQTNHTRWCINTIRSPADEHLMLETCREMKWINKYMKKCIMLFINKNLCRDARSTNYKSLCMICGHVQNRKFFSECCSFHVFIDCLSYFSQQGTISVSLIYILSLYHRTHFNLPSVSSHSSRSFSTKYPLWAFLFPHNFIHCCTVT